MTSCVLPQCHPMKVPCGSRSPHGRSLVRRVESTMFGMQTAARPARGSATRRARRDGRPHPFVTRVRGGHHRARSGTSSNCASEVAPHQHDRLLRSLRRRVRRPARADVGFHGGGARSSRTSESFSRESATGRCTCSGRGLSPRRPDPMGRSCCRRRTSSARWPSSTVRHDRPRSPAPPTASCSDSDGNRSRRFDGKTTTS